MDELLRHTILGDCLRYLRPSHLLHIDERDPGLVKSLSTLQGAQSDQEHADENTRLLADGEDHYGSGAILVEFYNARDSDVGTLRH